MNALTRGKEHLTMSTKIILNIEEGLSRQEMDDLRHLLSDAVSEFAAARTSPESYIERRYSHEVFYGDQRTQKVEQVRRCVALATKLHPSTMQLNYTHVLPHVPTPVLAYYKDCEEDDLDAMTAALAFLPASQFGERKGWVVLREQGVLTLLGPDEQRAVWNGTWHWVEEVAIAGAST